MALMTWTQSGCWILMVVEVAALHVVGYKPVGADTGYAH